MAKKQSKQNAVDAAVISVGEQVLQNYENGSVDFANVEPALEDMPAAGAALNSASVVIDKMRSDRAAEGKGKRMALVTGTKPEKTVAQIPGAILDGILGRHIAHAIEEVTIKAKTSPTKKDESRQFDAFYALDAEGMLLLSGGKMEPATPAPAEGKDERSDAEKAYGACDHFNYGRLLNVRQVERGRLEASIEGPEKSIAKLVKAMIDGGLAENETEARDEVISRLKKKGQLAPDYEWAGAAA